jgi:hypothetical protein
METALARARSLAPDDRVAAGLIPYLEEHIPEERDHDEWLLEDLEVLGQDRSTLLRRPPTPTAAALVGSQYYWIVHYHPVALLGYIAVLEGYAPSVAQIDHLASVTGFERRAFRTLLEHARLDDGHARALDDTLDALPLSSEHAALLGMSAMYTVAAVARLLDQVAEG